MVDGLIFGVPKGVVMLGKGSFGKHLGCALYEECS